MSLKLWLLIASIFAIFVDFISDYILLFFDFSHLFIDFINLVLLIGMLDLLSCIKF